MKYVAPQTKSSEVELENNFCGSAIQDDKKSEVTTNKQEIEGSYDFGIDSWY